MANKEYQTLGRGAIFSDLAYSPERKPYIGLPIDAIKDASEFYNNQYNLADKNKSDLEDLMLSIKSLPFDEQYKNEVLNNYTTSINDIASKGRLEDNVRPIAKLAKKFMIDEEVNRLQNNLKSRTELYADLKKQEDESKMPEGWADYQLKLLDSKYEGAGGAAKKNIYNKDMGIVWQNIAEQVQKLTKDWKPNEDRFIVTGYNTDGTPITKHVVKTDGGYVDFLSREIVDRNEVENSTIRTLLADPRNKASLQREIDVDNYTKGYGISRNYTVQDLQDFGIDNNATQRVFGKNINELTQQELNGLGKMSSLEKRVKDYVAAPVDNVSYIKNKSDAKADIPLGKYLDFKYDMAKQNDQQSFEAGQNDKDRDLKWRIANLLKDENGKDIFDIFGFGFGTNTANGTIEQAGLSYVAGDVPNSDITKGSGWNFVKDIIGGGKTFKNTNIPDINLPEKYNVTKALNYPGFNMITSYLTDGPTSFGGKHIINTEPKNFTLYKELSKGELKDSKDYSMKETQRIWDMLSTAEKAKLMKKDNITVFNTLKDKRFEMIQNSVQRTPKYYHIDSGKKQDELTKQYVGSVTLTVVDGKTAKQYSFGELLGSTIYKRSPNNYWDKQTATETDLKDSKIIGMSLGNAGYPVGLILQDKNGKEFVAQSNNIPLTRGLEGVEQLSQAIYNPEHQKETEWTSLPNKQGLYKVSYVKGKDVGTGKETQLPVLMYKSSSDGQEVILNAKQAFKTGKLPTKAELSSTDGYNIGSTVLGLDDKGQPTEIDIDKFLINQY